MSVTVQIGRSVPMSENGTYAEIFMLQPVDKCLHSFLLFGSACVGWVSATVQATDITNSYTSIVPADAMCARLSDRTSAFDSSVQTDDKMITDAVETPLAMPPVYVRSGEILSAWCSGTVDNDRVDCSHKFVQCF